MGLVNHNTYTDVYMNIIEYWWNQQFWLLSLQVSSHVQQTNKVLVCHQDAGTKIVPLHHWFAEESARNKRKRPWTSEAEGPAVCHWPKANFINAGNGRSTSFVSESGMSLVVVRHSHNPNISTVELLLIDFLNWYLIIKWFAPMSDIRVLVAAMRCEVPWMWSCVKNFNEDFIYGYLILKWVAVTTPNNRVP